MKNIASAQSMVLNAVCLRNLSRPIERPSEYTEYPTHSTVYGARTNNPCSVKGKVGLPVGNVDAMDLLVKGVRLERVSGMIGRDVRVAQIQCACDVDEVSHSPRKLHQTPSALAAEKCWQKSRIEGVLLSGGTISTAQG